MPPSAASNRHLTVFHIVNHVQFHFIANQNHIAQADAENGVVNYKYI